MGKRYMRVAPNGKVIAKKSIQAAFAAFEESFDESLDHIITLLRK